MALQALSSGLGSVKKAAPGSQEREKPLAFWPLAFGEDFERNRVAQRETPLEKNLREATEMSSRSKRSQATSNQNWGVPNSQCCP